MHKIAPCKDCTWRMGKRIRPNCHDTCERFRKWKMGAQADRRKREEIEEYISDEIRKKERYKHTRGGKR